MDCIKATTSAALYPWRQFWRLHQIYLDKTVLHLRRRWLVTAVLASIFALRVFYLRGFYAVSICLCSDEFQPFIGRRSEFKLWYTVVRNRLQQVTVVVDLGHDEGGKFVITGAVRC
ncbi:Retrieval of early ER protein Rer1 [Artemisia annua]|uniref:Retrieval of early ER protein Rer1 n=1 Tax=Artemisia annua TaxID=35608 RepID=A0A2U1QN81_ARTAN|nr:Retrieval of early ER protein Rer1 [Artemisia annua]